MSDSSILGGTTASRHPAGRDVDTLGPSDSSDSGSDVQGEQAMPTAPDNVGEWGAIVTDTASDSDAGGTGERASADGDTQVDGADILPDRIIENIGADDDPANRRRSEEAAGLSADEDDADARDEDAEESR